MAVGSGNATAMLASRRDSGMPVSLLLMKTCFIAALFFVVPVFAAPAAEPAPPNLAIIIAVVGAFQGFRTESNAASVGRQTTIAVVQSIFLVIVCDAALSIVFSALDL